MRVQSCLTTLFTCIFLIMNEITCVSDVLVGCLEFFCEASV